MSAQVTIPRNGMQLCDIGLLGVHKEFRRLTSYQQDPRDLGFTILDMKLISNC